MTGSPASCYSSVPHLPKNRIIPLSANSLAWASPSRSSVARTYWERTSWMACLSVIDGLQFPSEGEMNSWRVWGRCSWITPLKAFEFSSAQEFKRRRESRGDQHERHEPGHIQRGKPENATRALFHSPH